MPMAIHANMARQHGAGMAPARRAWHTGVMRRLPLIAAVLLLAAAPALPAQAATVSAGQAEAKEAARGGGCSPTTVEVLQHIVGRGTRTVFKVGCSEDKDMFVLVECRLRICALMR